MEYSLKDSVLLYSSLIVACIGLFMLFLIMFFHSPEEKKISEISDDMIGKKIVLIGKIVSITNSKNNSTTFLKLIQECTIEITVFDNIIDTWNDSMINSSTFKITGKLQEFNGRKGIIADDIIILRNG